jgi:hypothetical protein
VRRSLRILRLVGILLAVLLVVGVAGFTWLAYWPFEGSVDRLEALVPADVEFVVRGSWKSIRESGWVQRNVVDHPLHTDLTMEALAGPPPPGAGAAPRRSLADVEKQINDSIPGALKPLMGFLFGTKTFGVEKDVLPGDLIVAGTFCSRAAGRPGPPYKELLVLTRVTSLVKFGVASTKHGFLRKMYFGPEMSVDEVPGGMLKIELRNQRPSKYGGCEGGRGDTPPDNVWYLGRVKDVVAVSNDEPLLAKALDLQGGVGERAIDRPDFSLKPTSEGIAAAVDLQPIRPFLNRLLTPEGSARGGRELNAFLTRFLTPGALDRMNAIVEPQGPDGILARADVTYTDRELHPNVRASYALTPEPFATGIARLVPERDTFAVALLRSPARSLLQGVYEALTRADRSLIDDHVRRMGRYKGISEFLDELAAHLGTNTGVAFSRLSTVFDQTKYETWFTSDEPDPMAILTVLVRIGPGHTREQVDQFLAERVPAIGLEHAGNVVREGITYSRLKLPAKPKDYELYEPAYLVTADTVILTSNEDYLHRIIDVMAGRAPRVAESASFRAVTGRLPGDATLALYVDVKNARDYFWDHRNLWVINSRSSDTHAQRYRAERQKHWAQKKGGPLTQEDLDKVNDEVDAEIARYRMQEYPRFVDEYRGLVDRWARFRAAALVMAARDGTIDGGISLLFTPPEAVAGR